MKAEQALKFMMITVIIINNVEIAHADLENYKLFWSNKLNTHLKYIGSYQFSTDASFIAGYKEYEGIYLFNQQGRMLWEYNIDNKKIRAISSVSNPSDGKIVAFATHHSGYKDSVGIFLLNQEGRFLWNNEFPRNNELYYSSSTAISLSSDYSNVVVAFDNEIVNYNTKGEQFWKNTLGYGVIEDVSISSDGSYVVAGSNEDIIYFFNNKGTILWSYKTGSDVKTVSITSDGSYVAAGSYDNFVYFFDRQGKVLWKYEANNDILHVSISQDGDYVAADSYGTLYIFNREGILLWNYTMNSRIKDLSVSSDGLYAVDTENIYFFGNKDRLYKIIEEIKTISETDIFEKFKEVNAIISPAEQAFNNGEFKKAGELVEEAKAYIETVKAKTIANENKKIETENLINNNKTVVLQEKAKGFNTEKADILILQAEQAINNGNYSNAIELADKAEKLAIDIDQDGIINTDDFIPSTPNNTIYSGMILLLVALVMGTRTFLKVKEYNREKLKKEAISAVSSFQSYGSNYKSGKLKYVAKRAFDSGNYLKAKDLAGQAKEIYQKEKHLIDRLEKLKVNRKFRDGISESLINVVNEKIENSNFNDAEKQLKEAEDVINQENIILEKIEYIQKEIPEIYKNYIKETLLLIERCMGELKIGNIKGADGFVNQAREMLDKDLKEAKYEKDKFDLIEDFEKQLSKGGNI